MKSIRSVLLGLGLTLFLLATSSPAQALALSPSFHSFQGREHEVQFEGRFFTHWAKLDELKALSESDKETFKRSELLPNVKFLFGPLTHREMAGPQRGEKIAIHWEAATVEKERVVLPYSYRGTWIIHKDFSAQGEFQIPVPMNWQDLQTPSWLSCTDRAPEHQAFEMLWYYWDPIRRGCDHQQGADYEMVTVHVGSQTVNTEKTFPEYENLIQAVGGTKRMQMTFAFGYVKDSGSPDADRDGDPGARQYQRFVAKLRAGLQDFQESDILQGEYRGAYRADSVIGHRFIGARDGVEIVINAVAAAGLDPMELFAKSFAHDHDGFFGWFGHSRVGSGFDAQLFRRKLAAHPEYYAVTNQYQFVYWGGCNSYSYYTLPFFDFKAAASQGADPHGTRGLDIIANGLPSYFSLNTTNALIVLNSLLRWKERPSYQSIIEKIESAAARMGIPVLAAVLGDEDNAP